MAQLHFYLPDAMAEKIKTKADHAHLSVSKYIAELAKRDVTHQWPDNYFTNLGSWQGGELQRPSQSEIEQRETFN